MKFGDLKGQPVVSTANAQKLGTVDTLLVDPQDQTVLGLRIRTTGFVVRREAVLLGDIHSFGADAITVSDASKLNRQDTLAPLKDKPDLGIILGARVLDEAGSELGSVSDIDFDESSGTITDYILSSNVIDRIRGHEHVIPAAGIKSIGNGMIVVAADAPAEKAD